MPRFVREERREGPHHLDALRDRETGAEIRLAPGLGLHWTHWIQGGRDLFWRPDNFFGAPPSAAFREGAAPLLFPMAGRTWDLTATPPAPNRYRLTAGGPSYEMGIHGLCGLLGWEEAGAEVSDAQARLQYRVLLTDTLRASHYPFDIDFVLSYALLPDGAVDVAFRAGARQGEAPFAFGLHPYFAIGSRTGLRLTLPARRSVPLRPGLGIPVEPEARVDAGGVSQGLLLDLANGWETVYDDLEGNAISLLDPAADRLIRIESSPAFLQYVVYTDTESPFLCLEPWTGGFGGFSFAHDPARYERCRMLVARPGSGVEGRVRFSCASASGGTA